MSNLTPQRWEDISERLFNNKSYEECVELYKNKKGHPECIYAAYMLAEHCCNLVNSIDGYRKSISTLEKENKYLIDSINECQDNVNKLLDHIKKNAL